MLTTPRKSTSNASTKPCTGTVGAERGDSGVGDDHVEPAEFGDGATEYVSQLGTIANVGLSNNDSPSLVLDEASGRVQVSLGRERARIGGDIAADIERDDVGTRGGHVQRMAAALSAGRTGDHRDFALKSTHIKLPSSVYSYFAAVLYDRIGSEHGPSADPRKKGYGGATNVLYICTANLR